MAGITKAATRLRVMNIMIKKISTKAAMAAISRSDVAYSLMSLSLAPEPPMYTRAPASDGLFQDRLDCIGEHFDVFDPSGPIASPSWVTMKRAALPSGDIIILAGLDVFIVEALVRDVEEVVAA